jgi:D-serine deaminase-like pyridoxal phosphate-dependent protein
MELGRGDDSLVRFTESAPSMNDPALSDLETPAALIDLDRVRANLRRVADYCRQHRLTWRPHAKTHKTVELAALQMAEGACGITVATLREAEVMSGATQNLLLAYPPVGRPKQRRLARLLGSGVRLTVGLDSEVALATVAGAAREAGVAAGIAVEVDVGMRRVGLQTVADTVALARVVADTAGVELRGIMFYPGHLRELAGPDDAGLRSLVDQVDEVVTALDRAGLPPLIVSGGSTPTLWHSHLIPALTEIRPGTNIFNDRTTVAVGACSWEECAYSVLAMVVSTAVPGQAVIDAGSKALSREEVRGGARGFGALLDDPSITVSGLSEEHGLLDLRDSDLELSVGDRVRVVPNHVCVSVNLQERLHVLDGDRSPVEWTVAARGR